MAKRGKADDQPDLEQQKNKAQRRQQYMDFSAKAHVARASNRKKDREHEDEEKGQSEAKQKDRRGSKRKHPEECGDGISDGPPYQPPVTEELLRQEARRKITGKAPDNYRAYRIDIPEGRHTKAAPETASGHEQEAQKPESAQELDPEPTTTDTNDGDSKKGAEGARVGQPEAGQTTTTMTTTATTTKKAKEPRSAQQQSSQRKQKGEGRCRQTHEKRIHAPVWAINTAKARAKQAELRSTETQDDKERRMAVRRMCIARALAARGLRLKEGVPSGLPQGRINTDNKPALRSGDQAGRSKRCA